MKTTSPVRPITADEIAAIPAGGIQQSAPVTVIIEQPGKNGYALRGTSYRSIYDGRDVVRVEAPDFKRTWTSSSYIFALDGSVVLGNRYAKLGGAVTDPDLAHLRYIEIEPAQVTP